MASKHTTRVSATGWVAGVVVLAMALTGLTLTVTVDSARAAAAPALDCLEPRFFAQAEEPIGTTQLYEGTYTAAGESNWTALGATVTGANLYNAIAFNPVDEYIYGTTYGDAAARGKFVRIDRFGTVTNLGVSAPSLGAETYSTLWDSGEFDAAGNYYVASGNAGNAAAGTIYKIAGLAASTGSVETQPTLTELTLSPVPDYADFSFKDGYLWTHNYGNANLFYRIDASTGAVTSYSSSGVLPIGSYGSVFTMTNGNLAFIGTDSKMYQVAVTGSTTATPTFELVSTVAAPTNQRSDATNCSTAQQASLSVTKTGPDTVIMGEQISWTVTVTNDGPGVSSGFVAIDSLPTEVTGVTATSTDSNCVPSAGIITCNGGRLAVGQSAVITVTATAPMTIGSVVNTVRVVGNEDSTANSSAPATTEVTLGTTAGGSDTAELALGPGEAGASVTDGTHGTVVNDNGTLVYTPEADFSGVDSFTYTPAGGGLPVTVFVTVVPVAVDDAVTTAVDTDAAGDVSTNDFGVNLTFAVQDPPTDGAVTLNPDGTFSYTPDTAFVGTDSFTYTATGDGGSATATVTVTVVDAPVAAADAVTTPANTAVEDIPVTSNDSGTGLTAELLGAPTNGTVIDNGDNTFSYTPDAGFSGSDSFTYTLNGSGGTATGTVTVTVTPTAVGDLVSTSANADATGDVIANDIGSNRSAAILAGPSHGEVSLAADGTFTYSPDTGYSGSDSFTYTLTADGGTATGTVTVGVTPVAPDDAATTTVGQAVTIDVLANDAGTGLTITSATAALHGTVTTTSGDLTYTPDPGFSGTDAFSYSAEDTTGNQVTASVTVQVAPVATGDTATTSAASAVTFDALANDVGTGLSVTATTSPAHGTVTVNPDGTVTFTPDAGYSGFDTFDYTVTDAAGLTASATVSVTVTPAAAPDSRAMVRGGAVRVSLLGNDMGSALVVTSVTQPANGSLVLNPDGTATYTPVAGFTGSDSFSYTVTDAAGQSVTSIVTIDIELPTMVVLPVTGAGTNGLLLPAALLVLIGAGLLAIRPRRVGRHLA